MISASFWILKTWFSICFNPGGPYAHAGVLVKTGGGGKKGAGGAASSEPRCWYLLSKVLSHDLFPSASAPPPLLVEAATAAARDRDGSRELVDAVARCLGVLHSRFESSFRPSLEHLVGLCEATLALEGTAAAGLQLVSIQMLLAQARSHPLPRKVFQAVIPRLVDPIVRGLLAQGSYCQPRVPVRLDGRRFSSLPLACSGGSGRGGPEDGDGLGGTAAAG